MMPSAASTPAPSGVLAGALSAVLAPPGAPVAVTGAAFVLPAADMAEADGRQPAAGTALPGAAAVLPGNAAPVPAGAVTSPTVGASPMVEAAPAFDAVLFAADAPVAATGATTSAAARPVAKAAALPVAKAAALPDIFVIDPGQATSVPPSTGTPGGQPGAKGAPLPDIFVLDPTRAAPAPPPVLPATEPSTDAPLTEAPLPGLIYEDDGAARAASPTPTDTPAEPARCLIRVDRPHPRKLALLPTEAASPPILAAKNAAASEGNPAAPAQDREDADPQPPVASAPETPVVAPAVIPSPAPAIVPAEPAPSQNAPATAPLRTAGPAAERRTPSPDLPTAGAGPTISAAPARQVDGRAASTLASDDAPSPADPRAAVARGEAPATTAADRWIAAGALPQAPSRGDASPREALPGERQVAASPLLGDGGRAASPTPDAIGDLAAVGAPPAAPRAPMVAAGPLAMLAASVPAVAATPFRDLARSRIASAVTLPTIASAAAPPVATPLPAPTLPQVAAAPSPRTETSTPSTPAPARPLTAVSGPAPAGVVFGAAIAAAQEQDRRAAADPVGLAAEPVMSLASTAAPLASAAPASIPATPLPTAPLDTRDARWPQAMVSRIEALRDAADAGDTRIRLLPDALGTIDVALRRDGDLLHVHFTAEEAQTRALIADAQPRLADAAEQRGLRLGQTSVDAAPPAPATGSTGTGQGGTGQGSAGQTASQSAPGQHPREQPRQPAPEQRRPAPAPSRTARASAETADDARIA